MKITDWDKAIHYFSRAYETSKNVYGEFDKKTSQVLV